MAENFIISTESTADLPEEYVRNAGICVTHLSFEINGKSYPDAQGNVLDLRDFYQMMREGATPKTSQITPEQWRETFTRYLRQGLDILHVGFSSGLSGTVHSAKITAEQLSQEFPDRRIMVVDTYAASLGEGLAVHLAVEKKKTGASLEETAAYLESKLQNICHYFTVDDLKYLHRGGRVSKSATIVGSILGIKPLLHVNEKGELIPVSKVRGRRSSLDWLVDRMEIKAKGIQNNTVFISHGDAIEDAQYVADAIRSRMEIKDFVLSPIGPVIGSHAGPGTIALFFLGGSRAES